jgi:sugar phosphate isomerase/epimerase
VSGPATARPSVCWGTNVHPAEDLRGILAMLDGPAAAVRARHRPGGVLGLGLWLPAAAARAIAGSEEAARAVRERLAGQGLRIDTVNAFPYGGFHAPRVKEAVYAPSWGDPARFDYTLDVARALARLLEPGSSCVASTLPGTWKRWSAGPAEGRRLAEGLAAAARELAHIADATGVRVILAPEPEPGCTLETVREAADFWRRDLAVAVGAEADRLLPHLGICADLCHLAVSGRDPAESLAFLRAAGVPVAKVQVSAALEIPRPAEDAAAVEALRAFDEPRWLHQAAGRSTLGTWRTAADLPEVFADLAAWRRLAPWRIHFHAPIHRDEVAGVRTTSALVAPALREALAGGGPPPVLEVETYTWSAVPGAPEDLAAEIARELLFAEQAAGAPPIPSPPAA